MNRGDSRELERYFDLVEPLHFDVPSIEPVLVIRHQDPVIIKAPGQPRAPPSLKAVAPLLKAMSIMPKKKPFLTTHKMHKNLNTLSL